MEVEFDFWELGHVENYRAGYTRDHPSGPSARTDDPHFLWANLKSGVNAGPTAEPRVSGSGVNPESTGRRILVALDPFDQEGLSGQIRGLRGLFVLGWLQCNLAGSGSPLRCESCVRESQLARLRL